MRSRQTVLAFAAVGIVVFALPGCRPAEPAAGITLASAEIELPDDVEILPAGPNADLVAAKCGACHSPGMLTTQPVLKPEQWAATVKKMREVYQAPVADGEVPAILAYLNALSSRKALPAAAATPAAAAP